MQYLKKASSLLLLNDLLDWKVSHQPKRNLKWKILHFISLLFSCVSVLRGAFGESTMTAGTQTLIPIITFLVLSIGLVIVLAVLLWKTKTALNVATFKINQHQEAQHLTNWKKIVWFSDLVQQWIYFGMSKNPGKEKKVNLWSKVLTRSGVKNFLWYSPTLGKWWRAFYFFHHWLLQLGI